MSNRNFFLLLFLAIIVYAFNLRLDVMEIDAAQYAAMGWEMLTTHSFFKVHCLHNDYLDKPPLIFWLGSLSYAVFGFNNFAYKLPSFLFALLAVFSTYRLAKLYYDESTARMSAVMLATCQAMFLITNDVRTDTLLMGSVIFSIWQWAEFFEQGKTFNLLAGSVGLSLALLAKGPIGLVATGAALLPHLVMKGNWKRIFDIRLLLGFIIIALLLTPMCVGLYQQFGLRGLRFYFWTQSFGRITGESEWNNNPDPFFLWHTTAWAFLPWTLFLLIGWVASLWGAVKLKWSDSSEFITVNGFTWVLIMLSLSKYQLPHYIFVVYPLAAIMAARGFLKMSAWPRLRPWLTALQIVAMLGLVAVSALLQYAFKGTEFVSLGCLIVIFPLSFWLAFQADGGVKTFSIATKYIRYRFNRFLGNKSQFKPGALFGLEVVYKKLFFVSALAFLSFNFLLSAFYFPAILKYQPQSDFGRYAKAHPQLNFVCYNAIPDYAIDFYAQQMPQQIWNKEDFKNILNTKKNLLVYATPNTLKALQEEHLNYTAIEDRNQFSVANLTFSFLNPSTRVSVCDKVYLLQVNAP